MKTENQNLKKIFSFALLCVSFLFSVNVVLAAPVLVINTDDIDPYSSNTLVLDSDDSGGDISLQFGETLGEYLKWDSAIPAFSFSNNLTLEGNELKDFKVDNLASAPTCDGTTNGRMYHNTSDSKTYVCNGTEWRQIDVDASLAGDTLGAVQARNSAGFTLTTQDVWYDITFDQTDVETDSTAIEHNNINTERIDIKQDGVYRLTYEVDAADTGSAHQVQARLYLNGTTLIPGSYLDTTNGTSEHAPLTASVLDELTAGDYITLQVVRLTDNTLIGQPTLTVVKLDGVKGDQGLPGSVGTGTNENTFILDLDDTGGDVELQFGSALSESLKWNNVASRFDLSNDLNITGNLTLTGTVDGVDIAAIGAQAHTQNTDTGTNVSTFTLDNDYVSGDVNLIFGNTINESLIWSDTADDFIFSDDVALNFNELKQFKIENSTTPLTCDASNKGRLYHNTTSTLSYICDGSIWKQIDSTGGGGGDITYNEVNSNTATNTTSATPVTLSGMTYTPAAGTWLVTFSATGNGTDTSQQMQYGIYKNSTQVSSTNRKLDFNSASQADDLFYTLHSQAVITANGTDVIDTRYWTDSGTFTVEDRSMVFIRLGD